MSRSEIYQGNKPKSKRISAGWRGVGCGMILALTLGAYWLGGVVLSLNQKTPFIPVKMPPREAVGFEVGPLELPVGISASDPSQPAKSRVVTVGPVNLAVGTVKFYVSWIQLAMAAVVDVVVYALMNIIYFRLNPLKPGPLDAPPVRPRKGRQKSLIR
jgi:hypothetical protein